MSENSSRKESQDNLDPYCELAASEETNNRPDISEYKRIVVKSHS